MTTDSPELAPCPFCGGEADIEQYGNRRQSSIYQCRNCSCRLETGEEWDHGADWNRRPDRSPDLLPGEDSEHRSSVRVKSTDSRVAASFGSL